MKGLSPNAAAVLLSLTLLVRGALAADATALATPAPSPGWEARGMAREEYRLRDSTDPNQSGHDARLHLDLGVSDRTGRYQGNANLAVFWTLRRALQTGTSDALGTVYDARNPALDVFHLSGEYQGEGALRLARVGRQQSEHGRPATFDGAYALLRPGSGRLSLFAFGGRSEHFFEVPGAGGSLFEDWIASVGATGRVLPTLKVEADYRLLQEVVTLRDDSRAPVTDHSYGASAWLRHSDALWGKLSVRGINAKLSEVSLGGRTLWPRFAVEVDGRVKVQPMTLDELDELESPFFLTLGRSLPNARWSLDVFRVFPLSTGSWEAHLGWSGRQLIDAPEEPFNRNLGRVYLQLGIADLGLAGLSANVSLERVSASAFPLVGKGLLTFNGAVAYERGRLLGELGTQYHRYEYTYYLDPEETADVRAVYAEARFKPLDWLSLRARYAGEFFDRSRHTFTVGLSQTY